eukprot:m.153037 g.153037  ORF g.153037 m.153037 type:complete len:646 (-) comp14339_c0_seq1:98-2035(-)
MAGVASEQSSSTSRRGSHRSLDGTPLPTTSSHPSTPESTSPTLSASEHLNSGGGGGVGVEDVESRDLYETKYLRAVRQVANQLPNRAFGFRSKTLVAPPMASAPSLAHTLTLPDPTTYTPDAPRPHADADPRASVTRAWGSGGRRQSTGHAHTHTHTHAHAHTHARTHTHAPSPTHEQHRRLTSVWGGAAEGGDTGGDDDSVEAVSKWIDKRRGQHADLETMGISEEWLASKSRCPSEQRYFDELRRTGSAGGDARGSVNDRMPRRRSTAYVARAPSFTHDLEVTGAAAEASAAAAAPPHSAQPQHRGRPPSSAARTAAVEPMAVLRRFVKQNRWRLHDLFSRCGYTDTYTMTTEQVASLLERVGGIVPVDFALKHSVAFANAINAEGSLDPLTPEELRALINSFGPDRFGQIDYRVILDDHKARDELERLRRVDRNRRRRDPTTPSVHECIADSIAQYGSPVRWLADVGRAEQARDEGIAAALAASQRVREAAPQDTSHPTVRFGNAGSAPPGKQPWHHSARTRARPWHDTAVHPIPPWKSQPNTARRPLPRVSSHDEERLISTGLARALQREPGWNPSELTARLASQAGERRGRLIEEAERSAEVLAPYGVSRAVPFRGLVPPAATTHEMWFMPTHHHGGRST